VKETVEMHHGQITVESKLGEGTRFLVSLPVAPSQTPAANGGSQTPRLAA
jgi:signal transduction histidine kinase